MLSLRMHMLLYLAVAYCTRLIYREQAEQLEAM
jgi:hypothetical protein